MGEWVNPSCPLCGWKSLDDLPNIEPEDRPLFSALLAEILVP
jgi:hypothetical protein